MTFLKLPNPGDSATLNITAAGVDTEGEFPSAVFTADNGDRLSLPLKTAKAQLERLGLTVESAAGHILTFSRSEKLNQYGKPFWNIDATGNGKAPARPAKPPVAKAEAGPGLPVSTRQTGSWGDLEASYRRCLDIALATVGKLKGVTVSDVKESAGTLFIEASKRGLQAPPPKSAKDFSTVPEVLEDDDVAELPY